MSGATSTSGGTSAGGSGDERLPPPLTYSERIEQRAGGKGANYTLLWPIFLAPVIPLIGLGFK